MTNIVKKPTVVYVDGKRHEIPAGKPLPAGISDQQLRQLVKYGAIEERAAPATPAPKPPAASAIDSAPAK
jgi:hypothetical protein